MRRNPATQKFWTVDDRFGSHSVIRRCRLEVRFARKRTRLDELLDPAGLALELLFERRHGPPLFRDLQDLLLNKWIARHEGEFFALACLVAVLVGLAFRHRTVPWADQRG
jgi:hypothetical protein